MNEFKFSCPHCKQHLQCDEQFAGRQITCPACKMLIRIPPAPDKVEEYEPESGQTWGTFVPSGDVSRPEGLSLDRKPPIQKPEDAGKPGD